MIAAVNGVLDKYRKLDKEVFLNEAKKETSQLQKARLAYNYIVENVVYEEFVFRLILCVWLFLPARVCACSARETHKGASDPPN